VQIVHTLPRSPLPASLADARPGSVQGPDAYVGIARSHVDIEHILHRCYGARAHVCLCPEARLRRCLAVALSVLLVGMSTGFLDADEMSERLRLQPVPVAIFGLFVARSAQRSQPKSE
jgi:hypothetical protein